MDTGFWMAFFLGSTCGILPGLGIGWWLRSRAIRRGQNW